VSGQARVDVFVVAERVEDSCTALSESEGLAEAFLASFSYSYGERTCSTV
jgi:hypothetical protein